MIMFLEFIISILVELKDILDSSMFDAERYESAPYQLADGSCSVHFSRRVTGSALLLHGDTCGSHSQRSRCTSHQRELI